MRVLVACEVSGAVREAFAARGHFVRSCDLKHTERLEWPVKFRCDFGCYYHNPPERGADENGEPICWDCVYDEPWCHEHGMFAHECNCLGPTEDEAEYEDGYQWDLKGARHHAGDLFDVEDIEGYDLLIAHPPCTHLAVSGARWCTRHWVKKKSHPKGGYWHDPTEKLAQQVAAVEFVKRIAALPVKRIAVENPLSRLSTLWRRPDQTVQPYEFGDDASKQTCLWLKGLPKLRKGPRFPGRKVQWNGKTVERWSNQTDSGQNRETPTDDPETRRAARAVTYMGIANAMADQWGDTPLPQTLFGE